MPDDDGTAPAPDPAALTPTGHPGVDSALGRLRRVAELPPGEQIDRYNEVHRSLHETLSEIDTH